MHKMDVAHPQDETSVAQCERSGTRRDVRTRTADSGKWGEFELFNFGMFEEGEVGMSMKDRSNTAYPACSGQPTAGVDGSISSKFRVGRCIGRVPASVQSNENSNVKRCIMHVNEITLIGQL